MAINKMMMAALRALSYADIDVKKNYKLDRAINRMTKPSLKILYKLFDYSIMLDDHEIPVRVFLPKEQRSNQVLLFFHGGGWVSGDIESYTKPCAVLANQTGRRVVSVDYRLAPEHPFPLGLRDCYQVARELFTHAEQLDTTAEDIVLIGDSAGGNLAAAVSLMARDKQEFQVHRQILFYPSTYNDHTESSPFHSITENGTDYLLTSKRIQDYMELYIQNEKDMMSPYFAPLLAHDLSHQPKTLIITAQYDPLRDEGEAYGRKLKENGNRVEIHRIPDALHGFFSLPVRFAHVKQAYYLMNLFLDEVSEDEKRLEQT